MLHTADYILQTTYCLCGQVQPPSKKFSSEKPAVAVAVAAVSAASVRSEAEVPAEETVEETAMERAKRKVLEDQDPKRRFRKGARENDSLYSAVVSGHEEAIKSLFERVGRGSAVFAAEEQLDAETLSAIVAVYQGILATCYALHTTHHTPRTTHYTLHTAHCTLHTAHCTLHTAHYCPLTLFYQGYPY